MARVLFIPGNEQLEFSFDSIQDLHDLCEALIERLLGDAVGFVLLRAFEAPMARPVRCLGDSSSFLNV